MIVSGYNKLTFMKSLQDIFVDGMGSLAKSNAHSIISNSLEKERVAAKTNLIIGAQVMPIGISFFWLFANSWHVTSTDWIGGVQGLIHALTVMEVTLAVLLYYMIKDGKKKLNEAKYLDEMSHIVLDANEGVIGEDKLPGKTMDERAFSSLSIAATDGGWSPFWTEDIKGGLSDAELKTKLLDETEAVHKSIISFTGTKNTSKTTKLFDATELTHAAFYSRMEGLREFLYFVLNFIAFYGYLLGVLVYYYDDDENDPTHISLTKLFMTNKDADWRGNFIGDFMWTIEPMLILGSPILFGVMAPLKRKVKSD